MIETPRLVLRVTHPRDRPAMMAQFADPDVMRYLLPVADEAAYDAMIERNEGYRLDYGYTFWSVERRTDGVVIGTCGLKPGALGTPIAGLVEIGWRLSRDTWGQGYAREAAQATFAWGWANTDAARIVAITVPDNVASWTLMERLGMTRVAGGDFDHPLVPDGSPLKRHVLYTMDRPPGARQSFSPLKGHS